MSKQLLAAIALWLSASVVAADVLDVNVWKANPGQAAKMFEIGKQAKAIHEKHGATVVIFRDFKGYMRYIVGHESWQAWAKWANAIEQDEAWQKLLADASADPVMAHVDNIMLNAIERSENMGPVVETFIWQPLPGQNQRLFADALRAKAIHEKAGANVQVAADKLNRLIYTVAFENLEAYGKFFDTPNPEFDKFMAEISEDPTAQLVEVVSAMAVE